MKLHFYSNFKIGKLEFEAGHYPCNDFSLFQFSLFEVVLDDYLYIFSISVARFIVTLSLNIERKD